MCSYPTFVYGSDLEWRKQKLFDRSKKMVKQGGGIIEVIMII